MIIGVNARLLLSHRMEGIARYCWETTRRMIEKHPEHRFVLFFDRKYDEAFNIAENVSCISLFPQARHPILWKWWFDYSLTSALKKHKIDVLYSPDGFLSMRSKLPTLLVSHDITYFHYPTFMKKSHLSYYKKMVPLFHKKANHIIAVSKSTKEDLVKHFGLEPKKITVAYNALPPRTALGLNPKKKNYYLYLGSLHPRKNIVNLLLAFDQFIERLREEGYRSALPKLIIAGRSAFDTSEIFKTHENLKNKNEVEFKGMVSENEKWQLLAEATCMCYISKWEGFGIPILEAMHSKTPVITSKIGAQAEVAGQAALLVNPEDKEEISSKMYELYTNKTLQKELISKGNNRVNEFNWDKTAEIIFNELQELQLK